MAVARLVELGAGLILLMAAVSKAARLSSFTNALRTYRLVTSARATSLARVVVFTEGAVGVVLISQRVAAWALTGAGCLFLAFAVIGWIETSRGEAAEPRADCGCLGGVVRLRIGRTTIGMNAVAATACFMSAAAFALTGTARAEQQLDRVAHGAVWLAAGSLAALYWLTSYAVSVVAVMDDTPGIPGPNS